MLRCLETSSCYLQSMLPDLINSKNCMVQESFCSLSLCFYVLFLYRSVQLVLIRMLLGLIDPFVVIAHMMSFPVVPFIFLFEVSLY